MSHFIFTSQRLGFREWQEHDLDSMSEICADKEVMEYFPSILSHEQTQELITKRQRVFSENNFCYYAVEILDTNEFIGFIGIEKQEYDTGIETPFIDIGWRLKRSSWNKGYATEGALKCLEYAFEILKIPAIYSVAVKQNVKSMYIMEKIGMEKLHDFKHPLLNDFPDFQICSLYKIEKKNWEK